MVFENAGREMEAYLEAKANRAIEKEKQKRQRVLEKMNQKLARLRNPNPEAVDSSESNSQ